MSNSSDLNNNQGVNKSTSKQLGKQIIGLVILVTLTALLIWQFGLTKYLPKFSSLSNERRSSAQDEMDMDLFWQVYDLVQSNYLEKDKLSQKDLLYGAISGMVSATGDPYTSFFTPTENQSFQDGLEGVYGGIGAQLGFEDQQLVVVAPLEDSPAIKAGIKSGDAILAVDGEVTSGWSLAKAVDKIRGEAGTQVKINIAGRGEIEIAREEIKIPAVRLSWIENGQVAHLRVLRFGSDTIDTWDSLVKEVNDKNAKGVVVDVRNNPGGFLNAAIHLASDFFPDGVVVKKQTNSKTIDYEVNHRCKLCNIPVVVLINEGSASASEILAGAIQKRGRGELIGQPTFGKGTVQESIELDEGSAVHITSARWLLPSGDQISEDGLSADYVVESTKPVGPYDAQDSDAQLQKGLEILRPKL